MDLSPAMRAFVLHWGEMGTRWGVSRSVAQVHALLFLATKPLPADEIAETLQIARSNVSGAIRELQGWKLVKVSRELGDRRDHFTTHADLFDLVKAVVEGRREREFLPTMQALDDILEEAAVDGATPEDVRERVADMLRTMQLFDAWYREVSRLPRGAQVALLKAGGAVSRYLPRTG